MVRLLLVFALTTLASCIESSERRVADSTSSDDTIAPDVVHGDPCEQGGDERCSADSSAIEICGDDGFWSGTRCGDARVCIDYGGAHCLETTGDESCRDLLYCFLGCSAEQTPEDQESCAGRCFVSGTATAQNQLDDAQHCMEEAGCVDLPLKESLMCIDDTCGTLLAFCYFPTHGAESCADIIACKTACKEQEDADSCDRRCGDASTIAAQSDYAALELCLFFSCAGQTDQGCVSAAAETGACRTFTNQCVAPGTHTP